MKYKSLAMEVEQAYINKYNENKKIIGYKDVSQKTKVIAYDELPNVEVEGYPYLSLRDAEGKLQFGFMPNSHEICVGTTGSGKTTGCLEPRLRAVSSKKNKPCLFLTDPKGELFERNAMHLKNNGYKVYLVNFKDALHSHCWNPLTEIYDTWMTQTEYMDGPTYKQGRWYVNDEEFETEQKATSYIEILISGVLSKTEDLINQLVNAVIPDDMVAKHDPSWMLGAKEIFKGLIYCMLEDALDERSGFTRDNMNFMTIQYYYNIIRGEIIGGLLGGGMRQLLSTVKLAHKTSECESIKHMKAYFENAPTTSRSYLGIFENALQKWFTSKIYSICNGNDIYIDDYEAEPFAIFLITRDYEKSDFTIAGLFIDWAYRTMVNMAEASGGTLCREMYFMLDEFGNVPAINDFENKIATSRSRNIWFHMFVQSYSQLKNVYDTNGDSVSQIIKDNCNAFSFLGSQNYETKSTFAKECGKQTVRSIRTCLEPGVVNTQEVPILTVDCLENINSGEMYLNRAGYPIIKTRFERSYMCEEFLKDKITSAKDFGIETEPFTSEKYYYDYLRSKFSMDKYALSLKLKKQDLFKTADNCEIVV